MATTGAAVRMSHPPLRVLRLVNPIFVRVLASPLGRRTDGMIVLEFTGRRSGQYIRTPVSLHRVDGVPHLVTDRPWRLNFVDPAPVTVMHRGRRHSATAHLLDLSPAEVGTTLRRILDTESPRNLGIKVQRDHTATADELSGLGQSIIRLDPVSG